MLDKYNRNCVFGVAVDVTTWLTYSTASEIYGNFFLALNKEQIRLSFLKHYVNCGKHKFKKALCVLRKKPTNHQPPQSVSTV